MRNRLEMVRGDTLSFAVSIEFDENVQELETAYFTCKGNFDDEKPLFQKKLNSGIYYAERERNKLYYIVRIAPSDTKKLEAGQYYYDMEIGLNGDVFTILNGILSIENDVTW